MNVYPFNLLCVFGSKLKKPAYFTIQLIVTIIHESHYTFGTIHGSHNIISSNFYFYLQYF